jgi:ribose-phosphate pyrophosphokinase
MKKFAKLMFIGTGSLAFFHQARGFAFAKESDSKQRQVEKRFDNDISDLKLFSVTDQSELAHEIAYYLNTQIGKLQVIKGNEDEKPKVNIMEDINSKVIYLICSFNSDQASIKESIDSLITTISTMKSQSPSKVNVVLPYYGPSRHNGEDSKDLPLTEEKLSKLLEAAGADKIFTVNMHDDHSTVPFHIPLVEVDAHKLCASYFEKQKLKDLVIISTNEALSDKVNEIKEKLEQGGSHVETGILRGNNGSQLNYIGESIKDRDVILVDSVVDSGKPLYNISSFLKNKLGANSIHVFAPHGVLDDETVDFLDYSPITELVITNTLQLENSHMSPKIEQISVAKMLADLIAQSTFHKNLHELYQEQKF